MKGKRNGCAKRLLTHYFISRESFGNIWDDVLVVDMAEQEKLAAFVNGTVSAIEISEPYASLAVRKGKGEIVITSEDLPV